VSRILLERVSYLVNTISGSDLKRPVFCITLLPYHDDYLEDLARKLPFGQPGEYRDALRRVVTDCPHANVSLLEGGDLLTDVRGLCSDLIHPGDLGMMEIGNKLADRICQLPALKANTEILRGQICLFMHDSGIVRRTM
jgi:hypothetical protein